MRQKESFLSMSWSSKLEKEMSGGNKRNSELFFGKYSV